MNLTEKAGPIGTAMVVALLLAAGESKRMGRNKLLMPLQGKPLVRRALESLLASAVDQITVVLGHQAEETAQAIKPVISCNPDRVTTVLNQDFAQGMSTSIRAGLKDLSRECQAVMIALADEPFVEPQVIDVLITAYRERKGDIVVPTFQGRMGHPALFDRKYFPELSALKGDVGARSVVQAHKQELASLEVNQPGILLDVDDIETYQRLVEKREGPG